MRRNMRSAIFAAALLIATTLSLSTVKRPIGSPRLVSVEELPDYNEICPPEAPSHNPSMIAGLEENNLFAVFKETSVHAEGDTADVTRPPVRTIKDTYP